MIVLTTCSSRKKAMTQPELMARSLPAGTLDDVADEWLRRVEAASPTTMAGELYAGRGFTYASEGTPHGPHVVSAGLGLLTPTTWVPSYDLTVSAGPDDDVFSRIEGRRDPAAWWRRLKETPFSVPMADLFQGEGLVLAALSTPYLRMVSDDFARLDPSQLGRLRLFTATPHDLLPDFLAHVVMPYDTRLDGLDSPYRGTISDFAQRGLRHFRNFVLPGRTEDAASDHAALVREALAGFRNQPRRRPKVEIDEPAGPRP